VEFFAEVVGLLKREGAGDIGVFGGGGGTISKADAALMRKRGVDRIFFAGTPLEEIVAEVVKLYSKGLPRRGPNPLHRDGDRELAKVLSNVQDRASVTSGRLPPASRGLNAGPRVIGITGPGGAGKTTLVDELVLRYLAAHPAARIAILSHDPSIVGKGALLGDRATMIYSQDDRVFMRSLATCGQAGGLSPATRRCLEILKRALAHADGRGFDLVLVETVGIGQEALPFRKGLVDKTVVVMTPEYGSRLQLQKIATLDVADVVVVNKSDLPGAPTAAAEIQQRLAMNHGQQKVLSTVAKRHGDPGVDALYRFVTGEAGNL
jgi:putative protein kinase ArgK-like GTPase of G3E family